MEFQHRVVKFARGCRRAVKTIEIADILLRHGDVARIVVVLRYLVAGDDRLWPQSGEPIEGRDPCKSALRVGLGEKRVNAIVNGVSGND